MRQYTNLARLSSSYFERTTSLFCTKECVQFVSINLFLPHLISCPNQASISSPSRFFPSLPSPWRYRSAGLSRRPRPTKQPPTNTLSSFSVVPSLFNFLLKIVISRLVFLFFLRLLALTYLWIDGWIDAWSTWRASQPASQQTPRVYFLPKTNNIKRFFYLLACVAR